MTPQELHYLFTEAIRTMPPFEYAGEFTHLTREQVSWQAKTLAPLELQNNLGIWSSLSKQFRGQL